MKLKKSLAILAILGVTSLFSANIKSVDTLIDKINNTTDVKKKDKLLRNLQIELQLVAPKDYQEARELVNKKLKRSNNKS